MPNNERQMNYNARFQITTYPKNYIHINYYTPLCSVENYLNRHSRLLTLWLCKSLGIFLPSVFFIASSYYWHIEAWNYTLDVSCLHPCNARRASEWAEEHVCYQENIFFAKDLWTWFPFHLFSFVSIQCRYIFYSNGLDHQ